MVSYNTFRNQLMYKHYSINPPKIPILNGISIVRLQIGQLVPVCIQRRCNADENGDDGDTSV